MLPDELKTRLRQGLICFPLTDFDDSGRFDRTSFSARLEWLLDYGPSVVATGAAGEFFSLDPAEYAAVTAATVRCRRLIRSRLRRRQDRRRRAVAA